MKKEKNKKFLKTIMIYTIIFSIVAIFIRFIFHINGKIIMNSADGFNQHVVELQYFRELLINFIRTGKFSAFTWNIGFGYDLISEFAYFSFGDPFSYLSLLVPTAFVDELFSSLTLIRMYFVGVTFLLYCKYHKMSNNASLIGALMYTFSAYCVWASVTQPFFTDALIVFPLVMIGIEKIILEDKVLYYTLIIALTFFINFYFAYMIAVVIGIYGIALAIYKYKNEGYKKIIKVLVKTLLYSILGILITGIVLLPSLISFMTSERTATTIMPYSLSYYTKLFSNLLSVKTNGQWTFLGVSSIIMISLPWFFINRKKNYPIFITLIVLIFPLLFAKIGSVLSFFNFPNNRWTFVLAFIFALITVEFINNNEKLSKKELLCIGLFVISYLFLDFIFDINIDVQIEMQLALLILFVVYFVYKDEISKLLKRIKPEYILMALLTIGILYSNKYFFSVDGYDYTKPYINDGEGYNIAINTLDGRIPDFSKAINYIKKIDNDEKNYYRIGKFPHYLEDIALIKKYNAIGHYYSITPNIYGYLNMDLSNKDYTINRGAKDFDYRTKITTLLGNKYLIQYTGNSYNTIPYGYSKIEKYKGDSEIYKNKYSLPFGVLYTNYITEEEYENLSPLEKESSLLKSTVLKEKNISSNVSKKSNDFLIKELDYKLIDDYKLLNKNTINITNSNQTSIKLQIDDVINSEIYVSFDKLEYSPLTKNERINLNITEDMTKYDIAKVKKQYKWYQPNYNINISVRYNNVSKQLTEENPQTSPYYIDRSNYLFNLGYYEKTAGIITISLSSLGKYNFENLKVYAVSFDDYKEDIKALKKSNFKVTDYGNGYLNGTVNAENDGILQFSTIYRDGWSIYVDGKKVETFTSNKYFLGINIAQGEHKIEMRYKNPYILKGLCISLGSLATLGGLVIYRNKAKKRKVI